jgi:hypothetical protein
MLKPKKGFVQAQLNIERLTPIQWGGIMRAMDAYAEHYHEEQVKKLNIPAVIKSVCGDCLYYLTCHHENRDKKICDNYDSEP